MVPVRKAAEYAGGSIGLSNQSGDEGRRCKNRQTSIFRVPLVRKAI